MPAALLLALVSHRSDAVSFSAQAGNGGGSVLVASAFVSSSSSSSSSSSREFPPSSSSSHKDAHCSAHGTRLEPTSDFCKCDAGFLGIHCEFDQAGRRYVGASRCVHGTLRASDGACVCQAGWAGDACTQRRCDHGRLACPEGRHYCAEMACACHPGWAGPSCSDPANERCSARARHALGPCLHGGTFNEAACSCDCPVGSRWGGRNCGTCAPQTSSCPEPLAKFNTTTCACDCHEDQLLMQPCTHGGLFNPNTCGCDCPVPWGGPSCSECRETERHCYNGGRWNDWDCVCDCHAPWSPADRCLTCPLLDCKNGGVFLQVRWCAHSRRSAPLRRSRLPRR